MFCSFFETKTNDDPKIEYLEPSIVLLKKEDGTELKLACEERFPAKSKFTRFTNNADYAMTLGKAKKMRINADYLDILLTLSHWTYAVSQKKI